MHRIVNGDGLVMDLPADHVTTVEKINPLFQDTDVFSTDKGSLATVPYTDQNFLFFNRANLLETPGTAYNFPVTDMADEATISAGNINAAARPEGFEYNLEPNYASLNDLITGTRITQLRMDDGYYGNLSQADLAAHMLDTCKNPDKYPYIFFPVYNPGHTTALNFGYPYVNYFDIPSQSFKTVPPAPYGFNDPKFPIAQSAFWKVGYILEKVFDYLGFKAAGSFFTDPKYKNRCIYTRFSTYLPDVLPSNFYLPNILITDLFKFLRDRHHLAITFNVATGIATVESFTAIKNSTDPVDLTPYLIDQANQKIPGEQEVPAETGFTVKMKPDDQDQRWIDANNGTNVSLIQTLTVGDGSTPLDLDCTTTDVLDPSFPIEQRSPSVRQTTINRNNWPDGGIPPDMSYGDINDPTTLNNFPLRLIDYQGFLLQNDGSYFPSALPVDFNQDDMDWYKFKCSAKREILTIAAPPEILSQLDYTRLYCMRGPGLNYVNLIMESMTYDVPVNTDIIKAKIYAWTLDYNKNMRASITRGININTFDGTNLAGLIKAYFDPDTQNFDQMNIQVVATAGSAVYSVGPLINPTNIKGTGGVAAPISITAGVVDGAAEIRITQGSPKYVDYLGKRTTFTWSAAGYWFAPIDPQQFTAAQAKDFYWISY